MSFNDLIDTFDQQHLWHPYTSALQPLPALKVVSARERTLTLSDGTELIDAMSSWWCCSLGYQVPAITMALKEQVDRLPHVMFAGLTHDPAINLGKRLLKLLPYMEHIFYADSGSVATEVSLKMALQYQRARQRPERTNFLTVRSGYHGDTWNAMSVCDPEGMHTVFGKAMQQRLFAANPETPFPGSTVFSKKRPHYAPAPTGSIAPASSIAPAGATAGATAAGAGAVQAAAAPGCAFDRHDLDDITAMVESHQSEIAAVILEPVVQGAGGMLFYHPEFLKGLRELCDRHDIVLIADEIATGFGRTGRMFACEHAGIEPDIMLLGKGLTAGYMTLSAVLCRSHISQAVSQSDPYVFMHGPTFMANPLACSVACAAIDSLMNFDWAGRTAAIERIFKEQLYQCRDFKCAVEGRALGAIGVIELSERANVPAIQKECLKLGVWLRPMGNLLYAMPPLTTTDEEMMKICSAMKAIVAAMDDGTIASTSLPVNDSLI